MDYLQPLQISLLLKAEERASLVRLSIFWRIVLTSLVIIVVMAGVNLYALFQLRQLTALVASMATPLPAMNRPNVCLPCSMLNSIAKKYLAVRDEISSNIFIKMFAGSASRTGQILFFAIELSIEHGKQTFGRFNRWVMARAMLALNAVSWRS